jgi:CubicO group peptidase (beta-lactamase class C family)
MMNDTELLHAIETECQNTAGIVVQKNGNIIYEKYFDGHKETDTIHVFSVTKSITSLLIGIAIDQGYIRNVDQKVLEFFPDYQIKRGEKTIQNITLKDVITMTAPYKYRSEPFSKVWGSDDWIKASLDLLGGRKPVGTFRYSTVGTQILSGVLQNAIKRPLLEFAAENLFTPLGINAPKRANVSNKEEHIAFYKNKYASGWVVDPQGIPTASWGLTLTPKDMVKIGQLCLNDGLWNGKQLVSAGWIKESTSEHSRWEEHDLPYGYLWWLLNYDKSSAFAALGDGGNTIYVNPREQVVVAIASHFKALAKPGFELIEKYILTQI